MYTDETNKQIIEKIETELSETDTNKGCPLCSIIMDYEYDLLCEIQYEITNEKSSRDQIAGEGGFCDFHFRQFKKIASGKTNVLFLKTIVDTGTYKKENFTINCRLCKSVDKYEEQLLKIFAEYLSTENSRLKFESSNGICFVHLRMLDKYIEDKKISEWLRQTHIHQIERMQPDFDFMNNINSFYEMDSEQRRLINILIEKLAGRKTRSL